MWLIANCKNGVQQLRDCARAWRNSENRMVHGSSHPTGDAGDEFDSYVQLEDEVEADETFIGGLARNMHKNKKAKITGTGGAGKAIVMGLLDRTDQQSSSAACREYSSRERFNTLCAST